VPVGDREALTGAILSILNDEGLRKRLSMNGCRRAMDFSVERMVSAYEEFLSGLIEKD